MVTLPIQQGSPGVVQLPRAGAPPKLGLGTLYTPAEPAMLNCAVAGVGMRCMGGLEADGVLPGISAPGAGLELNSTCSSRALSTCACQAGAEGVLPGMCALGAGQALNSICSSRGWPGGLQVMLKARRP